MSDCLYCSGPKGRNEFCPEHGTEADNQRVRAALIKNQWASCDGCRGSGYCPECGSPREHWNDEADDLVPGQHFIGCSIAVSLNLPMRTDNRERHVP